MVPRWFDLFIEPERALRVPSVMMARAGLLTLIPDGRIGEAVDIARAAVWLASDDSDYVTGVTLTVDGRRRDDDVPRVSQRRLI